MSDEEPLFAGERMLETSDGSDTILLIVQGWRNRDLFAELLDDYDVVVTAPNPDEPIPEFDLCIVGEASYHAVADALSRGYLTT